jgi:hypothetical protein
VIGSLAAAVLEPPKKHMFKFDLLGLVETTASSHLEAILLGHFLVTRLSET